MCKEATSLRVGEFIDLTTQVQQVDGSAQETCGLVQISGPQLSQIGENYTLNEAGDVVVVFYVDIVRAYGTNTITYRVYSEPVIISFA